MPSNLKDKLVQHFDEHPLDNYAETVAERFRENMEKFKTNKEVFGDSQKAVEGEVRLGKRYRFKNGLYEVKSISDEAKNDEVMITLAKVLDTKVSDARNNQIYVPISDLKKARPFERYNQIVDKAYEIAF